jgi:hypothetical protein
MPHGRHLPGGQPGANAGAAAVALRVAGASFADVAVTLGLSSATEALHVVEAALAETLTPESVEVQRAEAAARLEALIGTVWPKATNPDHPEQLIAVKTARELIDRVIRLNGLDRPTELVVHTPSANELERWVTGMLAHTVPEVVEADVVGELGP